VLQCVAVPDSLNEGDEKRNVAAHPQQVPEDFSAAINLLLLTKLSPCT